MFDPCYFSLNQCSQSLRVLIMQNACKGSKVRLFIPFTNREERRQKMIFFLLEILEFKGKLKIVELVLLIGSQDSKNEIFGWFKSCASTRQCLFWGTDCTWWPRYTSQLTSPSLSGLVVIECITLRCGGGGV